MTSTRSGGATQATTVGYGAPALELVGATKSYGSHPAVCGVDLAVTAGEVVTVIGPSGCGKSTLLRLAAGLERPDGGEVRVGGRVVAGSTWVPPERRRVGMVFQDHALFPHLDVARNVAFGLDTLPRAERAGRVAEVLELVGLGHLGHRHPHELSGGEQQRVALARALAPRPTVVLLDEPFSSLDANLRTQVRPRPSRRCTRPAARRSWSPTTRPRRSRSATGWRCSRTACCARSAPPARSTSHPAAGSSRRSWARPTSCPRTYTTRC